MAQQVFGLPAPGKARRPTELRQPIEWLGARPRLCAGGGWWAQPAGRVMCGERAEKRLTPSRKRKGRGGMFEEQARRRGGANWREAAP